MLHSWSLFSPFAHKFEYMYERECTNGRGVTYDQDAKLKSSHRKDVHISVTAALLPLHDNTMTRSLHISSTHDALHTITVNHSMPVFNSTYSRYTNEPQYH